MKTYCVELSQPFEADLERYERLLLDRVTPTRVDAIVQEIVGACGRLETAPYRGTDWGYIRPGLRSVPALRRGTIVFAIDEERTRVVVLGWWWRGAPIATVLERYKDAPG